MTEPGLLQQIKLKAKEQANELLDEVLAVQVQTFEVNTDLNAESVDEQGTRLLLGAIGQLESMKALLG